VKAATYARFSTEKQRDESIEDQVRNCQRYASQHGLSVVHQFEDRAISGTSKNRPGFSSMLAAAQAGEFNVLLVDDLSRLSRDDVETKQVIRRFKFQGLRIVGVSDGYDSNAKGEKIQSTMRGLMNELYLDDLREKTHRGLHGQALAGNHTGGRCYGYRHVPDVDMTRLDAHGRPIVVAVHREVDEEQAQVVRQIFQWYADGRSPRAIAYELNAQGIPSPRGKKWQQTAIHGDPESGTGMLNNTLYVGLAVWNRREWRKNPDTGKRTYVERSRDEWVEKPMPELRIIPDELWARVRARQKRQAEELGERVRFGLRSATLAGSTRYPGRGPKYLFSGLLKCGCCGANYIIHSTTSYGCSLNLNGGDEACSNRHRLPRKLAEAKLLSAVRDKLLTPEATDLFVRETARLLRERSGNRQSSLKQAERRLNIAERQIANLMEAIKDGHYSSALRSELEKAEGAKAEAEAELKAGKEFDQGVARVVPALLPNAIERYRIMLEHIEGVLARDVAKARSILRELLGNILLHPVGGGLEAEMGADWSKVLSLACEEQARLKVKVVAGARFELATFGL
jgi:site-specific DNA recombinase